MPFICTTHYPEPQVDLHWWDLTESPEQLEQMCRQAGLPCQCDARADSRRREMLAERLLVACITGMSDVTIDHNADRAPRLVGYPGSVSIAHTRTQLCMAVGGSGHVGIDVENHGRRITAVRDAFLNAAEQQWIAPADALSHLVAWTAKEAMFKAVSVREGMHYRDQLVLHPFPAPVMGGTLHHSGERLGVGFSLITEVRPQYVLTIAWTGGD